jgi:hypothetical protein
VTLLFMAFGQKAKQQSSMSVSPTLISLPTATPTQLKFSCAMKKKKKTNMVHSV